MSRENARRFMKVLAQNKELQEEVITIKESGKVVTHEDIIDLAGENGYAFSTAELQEVTEERKAELLAEGKLDEMPEACRYLIKGGVKI